MSKKHHRQSEPHHTNEILNLNVYVYLFATLLNRMHEHIKLCVKTRVVSRSPSLKNKVFFMGCVALYTMFVE